MNDDDRQLTLLSHLMLSLDVSYQLDKRSCVSGQERPVYCILNNLTCIYIYCILYKTCILYIILYIDLYTYIECGPVY